MKKLLFIIIVCCTLFNIQASGQIINSLGGNGGADISGNGGPATVQINGPFAVVIDGARSVYIADRDNHRVRKVDASGNISTIAGTGIAGFSGDGAVATAAQLNQPSGVAVDDAGNVYIADRNNHRVRKVDASGNISTIAGTGTAGYNGDGGKATAAQLNNPGGVAVDRAGNVYIADETNHRIRKINTSGIITTIAGTGIAGFSGDGGQASAAQLNGPRGVAVDGAGVVYIADAGNSKIRRVFIPVTPSVSISASANNVCAGTSVTFTATPTNGGTTPAYQWKVNGNNIGTNSPSFNYAPANGDIVSVVLTSNDPNAFPVTATSNSITMVAKPLHTPSVYITALANNVCAGISVTFTATPANGGTAPAYQWKVNGSNAGTNSPGFSYVPANGDVVSAVVTSNATCLSTATANSNNVTMMVNPILTPAVSISASANNVCAGTSVTFTATPTNGGTTPAYQWKVNGTNAGTSSPSFSYIPASGDIVSAVITSNATCLSTATANSNNVTMMVNPMFTPAVSISASANNVCAGTSVTFTALPINGGTAPAYQWKVNGTNAGTNNASFSYVPANGDVVSTVLTSNATPCLNTATATSDNETMVVNPLLTPSVSITASANNVCAGTSASFTATPTNGGAEPAYQWKVNGNNTGTNSPDFSYVPANGDIVSAVLTSNASCLSTTTATGNNVTMVVNPLLTPLVNIATSANNVCAGTSVTFTATPANGGSAPAYQWKVNGNDSGTNSPSFSYNPANGDLVSVVLTSNATCLSTTTATGNSATIVMNPLLTPSVSIAASANNVCAGTSVTFTATPANGGTVPAYQWKVNGKNASANSSSFSYIPANGDVVSTVLTSNATCLSTATATSNNETMVVSPSLTPSVSITVSQNNVCPGTPVTFTAKPTNGGTAPAYQWKVNGDNAGTNSPSFSYAPVNGDVVSAVLTSNATPCLSTTTATSNNETIVVNPIVSPSVTIAASANHVCVGTAVMFTAKSTNGGTTPAYQWKVNGVIAGTNSANFSYAPADGDIVSVVLTSNAACLSTKTDTSKTDSIAVNPIVAPAETATANPSTNVNK